MKLRDKPCENCGWKYPGFHVCVDLSKPVDISVQRKHDRMHNNALTPQHRQALSDGASERWRRHREENINRDKRIVTAYANGMSMREISSQFGPHYQTIMNILHRAANRGEIELRPKGYDVRRRSNVR